MKDLTGQKFGRLIIINKIGYDKYCKNILWNCRCDCGKTKVIRSSSLTCGNTKSCGCLLKETTIERFTEHGHSTRTTISKTYRSWDSMIQRCTNPNSPDYKRYGGRGITVCKRWLKFPNFLKDMEARPQNRTLERINNDNGYHKSNCKWASRKQQDRNKRSNRFFTFNGKTQCMSDWAKEYNIHISTFQKRLKLGWLIEKALTTPVRKRGRK